jgi:hypothetical protein
MTTPLLLVFLAAVGISAATSPAPVVSCNIPCMTQALLHPDDVTACRLCAVPAPPPLPPLSEGLGADAPSAPSFLLAQARASAARLDQGDPDTADVLLSLQHVHARLRAPPPPAEAVAAHSLANRTVEEAEVQFLYAAGRATCSIYACDLWGFGGVEIVVYPVCSANLIQSELQFVLLLQPTPLSVATRTLRSCFWSSQMIRRLPFGFCLRCSTVATLLLLLPLRCIGRWQSSRMPWVTSTPALPLPLPLPRTCPNPPHPVMLKATRN